MSIETAESASLRAVIAAHRDALDTVELLRVAGIAEELSELLGTRVDVVAASLLRREVSACALADSVAV